MYTYDLALSTLQTMTGVQSTDTTNSALLIQFWNDSRRTVAGMNGGRWSWLELQEETPTISNQEYVQIPNHINKVLSIRQQNGSDPTSVVYRPVMVFDPGKWDAILQAKLGTTNVPYYCYQFGDRLYIQPIPSEDGDRVIMRGTLKVRDVNIADYVTGNIVSIANGATTVTGSSTTWTTSMADRWIRITESDSNNKGDGYFYQIASVTSTTVLELVKPYQGTSISAGSAAYRLGLITFEPEQYQQAPILRAVALYWQLKENMVLADSYYMQYDGGFEMGKRDLPGGLIAQMLEEEGLSMGGPYIPPIPRGDSGPFPIAPYYNPWLDATL